MSDPQIAALTERLRRFAAERGWQAIDTPHNLAVAVLVETAELLEHFQWLDQAQSAHLSEDKRREAELEMADVLIFLLRLADTLGIDLMAAAQRKLEINAAKYPADRARGRAAKYTEL
jgi:NTP pyrophosphatase (non-canonical NTP hydrolase)